MKKTCSECGLKANRLTPVVRLVDDAILYACRQCIAKLGIGGYLHPSTCECPHCREFGSFRKEFQ